MNTMLDDSELESLQCFAFHLPDDGLLFTKATVFENRPIELLRVTQAGGKATDSATRAKMLFELLEKVARGNDVEIVEELPEAAGLKGWKEDTTRIIHLPRGHNPTKDGWFVLLNTPRAIVQELASVLHEGNPTTLEALKGLLANLPGCGGIVVIRRSPDTFSRGLARTPKD